VQAVRSEMLVRLLVVSCTPVVEVLVKRPDIKYQLGFSVQNGVVSMTLSVIVVAVVVVTRKTCTEELFATMADNCIVTLFCLRHHRI